MDQGLAGSIEVVDRDGVTVVNLVGEHDVLTATDVGQELDLGAAAGDGLVVSLAQAEFLDSRILYLLFTADETLRRRGRRLVLHVATAAIVARVLDVSGLQERVTCTPSLDDAVAMARRGGKG